MDFLIEHNYVAEEVDELNLTVGDVVHNVSVHEEGWMIGVLNGKKGVFPSNFGKEIKPDNSKPQEEAKDGNQIKSTSDDEVLKEIQVDEHKPQAKKVIGIGFGNIFSGKQIQLKQTNTMEPKNIVPEETPKVDLFQDKKTNGGAGTKAEMVKAIFGYKPENPDELQIEVGDIITIIDKKKTDDGWWKGKLNDKIGVFPNNFVEPYNIDDTSGSKDILAARSSQNSPAIKGAPPPLLSAKPTKPKPAVSKPVNSDPVKLSTPHQNSKGNDLNETDGISFDAPLSHKPLVGPTAERVRRQNIRLPKKIDANIDETDAATETSKVESTKHKSVELSFSHNNSTKGKVATLPRAKATETATNNEKITFPATNAAKEPITQTVNLDSTSKPMLRSLSKTGSELDSNTKNTFPLDRPKESPLPMREELPVSKQVIRPKSHMFSNTFSRDLDVMKSLKTDEADEVKKRLNTLETKVTLMEEENKIIRKEFEVLSKNSEADIAHLKETLNKLMKEFEEEKAKRRETEHDLQVLTAAVDDMESSLN